MAKICWTGGHGPRPAMYDNEGQRLFARNRDGIFECYTRVKSMAGFDLYKVISEA